MRPAVSNHKQTVFCFPNLTVQMTQLPRQQVANTWRLRKVFGPQCDCASSKPLAVRQPSGFCGLSISKEIERKVHIELRTLTEKTMKESHRDRDQVETANSSRHCLLKLDLAFTVTDLFAEKALTSKYEMQRAWPFRT